MAAPKGRSQLRLVDTALDELLQEADALLEKKEPTLSAVPQGAPFAPEAPAPVAPPSPEPAPAALTATTKKKRGVSIGTKFLALILAALFSAVSVVVLNATSLFQKDNLNNIYVASDLLTAAKAGEVRAWLNALIQKTTLGGKALATVPSQGMVQRDPFLRTFEGDRELLGLSLYRRHGTEYIPILSWWNLRLAHDSKIREEALVRQRAAVPIPFAKLEGGSIHASSAILDGGQPLLFVAVPFTRSGDTFDSFMLAIAKQDKVTSSFADGGAYTLALVDREGALIAHPDSQRVKERESLASLPIVQKMRESTLEREFQEFEHSGVRYLGSYAKVGLAGLGVISQVPRSRAFEAGEVLIRRSVLIAVLVLSIAYVVAYLFAQTLVSPIRRLASATTAISQGNFKMRVAVNTSDELENLATSFNAMTGEIERKIDNLSKINESSKTISSTLEEKSLLEFALSTLMELLHAREGAAYLWTPNRIVARASQAQWSGSALVEGEPLSEGIAGQLDAVEQTAILSLEGVETLVIPFRQKAGTTGHALLRSKSSGKPFTDEDVFMAGTISTSVGISFENIDLIKKTADNARMEKELETAKLVQDTMFPPTQVEVANTSVRSYYTPASECGGDWWGMVELPGGKLLFAIGDATGHGVPAAMVTATTKSACSVLHRIADEDPALVQSPGQVLHYLNKAVRESTQGSILMTFFVAVLDTATGELSFATASHDPIYWYHMPESGPDGSPGSKDQVDVLLSEPGPRLGQNDVSHYSDGKVQLRPDDVVLLYTDGLPEAKNPEQEEYGERKFLRSFAKHAHGSPEAVRDGILADFRNFIQTESLHDDVTLVVVRWKPAS